jgi:hypothetical protein
VFAALPRELTDVVDPFLRPPDPLDGIGLQALALRGAYAATPSISAANRRPALRAGQNSLQSARHGDPRRSANSVRPELLSVGALADC